MRNIKLESDKVDPEKMTDSWFIDQLKERGWLVTKNGQTVNLLMPGYDPDCYCQKIKNAGWELFIEVKAFYVQIIIYKVVEGERVYKNVNADLDKTPLCATLKDIYENLDITEATKQRIFD